MIMTCTYPDVEKMYCRVKDEAARLELYHTLQVLPLVRQWHAGQYRKGPGQVPYLAHPLTMACHAIALGMAEDEILCAILLHDVAEDCGVSPDDMPVCDSVKDAVRRLTFSVHDGETKPEARKRYYQGIAQSPLAMLVKLLDRCNNVSGMASGFTPRRMGEYVQETREHVLPLIPLLLEAEPQWRHALWLIRYQLESLLHTFDHLL